MYGRALTETLEVESLEVEYIGFPFPSVFQILGWEYFVSFGPFQGQNKAIFWYKSIPFSA